MEKMLNDYLQFAKSQIKENTSKVDLIVLFESIKEQFNNEKLIVVNNDEIELRGRPLALKRSFENIIQN